MLSFGVMLCFDVDVDLVIDEGVLAWWYLGVVTIDSFLVQWCHVDAIEGCLLPEQGLADELIVQQSIAECGHVDPSKVLQRHKTQHSTGAQHTLTTMETMKRDDIAQDGRLPTIPERSNDTMHDRSCYTYRSDMA